MAVQCCGSGGAGGVDGGGAVGGGVVGGGVVGGGVVGGGGVGGGVVGGGAAGGAAEGGAEATVGLTPPPQPMVIMDANNNTPTAYTLDFIVVIMTNVLLGEREIELPGPVRSRVYLGDSRCQWDKGAGAEWVVLSGLIDSPCERFSWQTMAPKSLQPIRSSLHSNHSPPFSPRLTIAKMIWSGNPDDRICLIVPTETSKQ